MFSIPLDISEQPHTPERLLEGIEKALGNVNGENNDTFRGIDGMVKLPRLITKRTSTLYNLYIKSFSYGKHSNFKA